MHIKISTEVNAAFHRVSTGFNEELFRALNPPFPPVKLERFDGSKTGDIVSLELSFVFFKQKWVSEIVEDNAYDDFAYFIDVGRQLPFFLRYWRHKHVIKRTERERSLIIDDIEFKTGTWITDLVMYPLLMSQFLYRKPIYRRFFRS